MRVKFIRLLIPVVFVPVASLFGRFGAPCWLGHNDLTHPNTHLSLRNTTVSKSYFIIFYCTSWEGNEGERYSIHILKQTNKTNKQKDWNHRTDLVNPENSDGGISGQFDAPVFHHERILDSSLHHILHCRPLTLVEIQNT